MAREAFSTKDGATWIQTGGPNTIPYYLGCTDVDSIDESGGLIDTLYRCFTTDGTGWRTVGASISPPDPVKTALTTYIGEVANYLESISCPVTLFFHSRDAGKADLFTNYKRSFVLSNCLVGDKSYENVVMKETDDLGSQKFSITAYPPVHKIYQVTPVRQSISSTISLNNITFCNSVRCATDSGAAQAICTTGYATGNAPTGSPSTTTDVLYTSDAGSTWTATSADPFAATEDIRGITCFPISSTITRVIVSRGTTDAGNPAEIAYSDDTGTTWTTVNVGSTNAQYVQNSEGLFSLDQYTIWMVTNGGYIYFSSDGGVTWSTQSAGTATTNALHCVHAASNRVVWAAGASDTILRSLDGGTTWAAVTASGSGSTINSIFALDAQRAWVGTANGRLYYTLDGGTTWTRRRYTDDTAGSTHAIKFVNSLIGWMIHDTASPVGSIFRTIDGGYTWEKYTTPTNAGLNDISVCSNNLVWACGNVSGTTGVIIKATNI